MPVCWRKMLREYGNMNEFLVIRILSSYKLLYGSSELKIRG